MYTHLNKENEIGNALVIIMNFKQVKRLKWVVIYVWNISSFLNPFSAHVC